MTFDFGVYGFRGRIWIFHRRWRHREYPLIACPFLWIENCVVIPISVVFFGLARSAHSTLRRLRKLLTLLQFRSTDKILACISSSDADITFFPIYSAAHLFSTPGCRLFCFVNRLSSSGYRLICGTFLKTFLCCFWFVTQHFIDYLNAVHSATGKVGRLGSEKYIASSSGIKVDLRSSINPGSLLFWLYARKVFVSF